MASYIGSTRTNYFKVKDNNTFKTVCDYIGLEIIHSEDKVGFYGGEEVLIPLDIDELNEVLVEKGQQVFEGDDGLDIISGLLEDDEIMIVDHIGQVKLAFLTGSTFAYSNKGLIKNIQLKDIYDELKKLGLKFTYCEN